MRAALVTMLAIALLCFASARADESAVLNSVDSLREGAGFFQNDEFRKAALAWSNQSFALSNGETGISAALAAAFASVLASIAYQRAEDALAYAEWGNAQKYYLGAGTDWPQQRVVLASLLQRAADKLARVAAGDASADIDTREQFLLALDGLTGFATYSPPDDELARGVGLEPVATENRSYFARPLSLVRQEQREATPRSEPQRQAAASDGGEREFVSAAAASGDGSRERPFKITAGAGAAVALPRADAKPEPESKAEPAAESKSTAPAKKRPASGAYREYRLDEQDMQRARRAWSYFARNRHPESALVSDVEGGSHTSSWDMASQLAAIVSAHQVGVIDDVQFELQAGSTLRALHALPLHDKRLPSRRYRVDSALPVDAGDGWSAVSTGRLLIWLRILADWYPEYRDDVMAVISRWQFSVAIAGGQLHAAREQGGRSLVQQEGRLGFEQYAAAGFALWGLDVRRALALPQTATLQVFNSAIDIDRRPSAALVSDPFALASMELAGIEPQFAELARRVFEVQRERWSTQRRLTAMGSDINHQSGLRQVNHVYHADRGTAFNCSVADGIDTGCQALSSKIVYAWDALYGDSYSRSLLEIAEKGVSTKRGFYAGVYDDLTINRALTLETNAVVLESLLLKFRRGEPFLQAGADDSDSTLLFSRGSWD